MAVFDSRNLIDAIRDEIVIWDTSLAASEDDKELAWQRIADIFGITNVSKLKTKWASIRSCFARELRLEKEYLFSGTRKRKCAVYQYTKKLAFLRPFMRLKSVPRSFGSSDYLRSVKVEVDEPSVTDVESINDPRSQETADIEMFERCLTELSKEKAAETGETLVHKKSNLAKRRSLTPDLPANIGAMSSTGVKTALQTPGKNERVEEKRASGLAAAAAGTADDKDWDFCKFIYHKIKAVPDSEEKEDLQLSIHQMIVETGRKFRNHTVSSSSPTVVGASSHASELNHVNHRSTLVSSDGPGRSSLRESSHMPQTTYASTNGVESYQFGQRHSNTCLDPCRCYHVNGTHSFSASHVTNTELRCGQQVTTNSLTGQITKSDVDLVSADMPISQGSNSD